jgi:hypothetical protein
VVASYETIRRGCNWLLGASSAPSVRVRGQLGLGVDSSMMLATVVAVLVPLIYLESRSTRNAS